MNYSKSTIIQSKLHNNNKNKQKISEKEKNFLNKANKNNVAENNLHNLEKSMVLFTDEKSKMKYNFNKLMIDLQDQISQVQLGHQKPPYISNNFAFWRRQAFKKLESYIKLFDFSSQDIWVYKFAVQVDNKYLPIFIQKMEQPLFSQIYEENYRFSSEINNDNIKYTYNLDQEIKQLSKCITNWSIELEKTCDIMERAELYGIYNKKLLVNDNLQQSTILGSKFKQDLAKFIQKDPKSLLDWSKQLQNLEKKQIYNKVLLASTKKVKQNFDSKNLTWSTGLTIVYSLMSGNPISLGGILLVGLGSNLASKMLGWSVEALEKIESKKQIDKMIVDYEQIYQNLKLKNQQLEKQIQNCFEEIENLNTHENLDQKKGKLTKQQQQLKRLIYEVLGDDHKIFDENEHKYIELKEQDDDWVIYDYEQEVDDCSSDNLEIIHYPDENNNDILKYEKSVIKQPKQNSQIKSQIQKKFENKLNENLEQSEGGSEEEYNLNNNENQFQNDSQNEDVSIINPQLENQDELEEQEEEEEEKVNNNNSNNNQIQQQDNQYKQISFTVDNVEDLEISYIERIDQSISETQNQKKQLQFANIGKKQLSNDKINIQKSILNKQNVSEIIYEVENKEEQSFKHEKNQKNNKKKSIEKQEKDKENNSINIQIQDSQNSQMSNDNNDFEHNIQVNDQDLLEISQFLNRSKQIEILKQQAPGFGIDQYIQYLKLNDNQTENTVEFCKQQEKITDQQDIIERIQKDFKKQKTEKIISNKRKEKIKKMLNHKYLEEIYQKIYNFNQQNEKSNDNIYLELYQHISLKILRIKFKQLDKQFLELLLYKYNLNIQEAENQSKKQIQENLIKQDFQSENNKN